MNDSNNTRNNNNENSRSDEPVITVKDLSKKYGDFEAIKSLNFDIYPGETFGLIGPDGAGKTTTFHILGGVMEKTSGTALVLNTMPRDARLQIGYLTQIFSLYLDLSIAENMRYMAGLREVSDADLKNRGMQYLKLMNLDRFSDRLAGQLSGGMKQKLALCCALIARPKILLLDEPTTGVDPVSRREFWDLLATVTKEGVTVVVATPYLDEAERCSRLILMHEGEIQDTGTPAELKERLHLHRLEVRADKLQILQEQLKIVEKESKSFETKSSEQNKSSQNTSSSENIGIHTESPPPQSLIAEIQPYGDRLDILTTDTQAAKNLVADLAQKNNIDQLHIDVQEPTLENVFVSKLKAKSKAERELPLKFFKKREINTDEIAIEADNINKTFGHFQAVHNVNLKVKYGQIYGLLGANGAGKTTTIKMLCGLIPPSSGEMSLCGQTGNLRSESLRRDLGYMSQKFTLYDDLTILENLKFYCGVYCVPQELTKEKIDWVLRNSGLLGQEDLLTGKLPGGWKQRLAFGAAIMHEPSVLFLDEPTSGVDPLARREMWRSIGQLAKHGTAVLVTTHFLEEAEFCNNLGFMVAGELVAEGAPSKIKSEQPGKLYELRLENLQNAYDCLQKQLEPWRVSIFADSLHVVLDHPETDWPQLQKSCTNSGLHIIEYRELPYSLEDAFISIVQRAQINNNHQNTGQAA